MSMILADLSQAEMLAKLNAAMAQIEALKAAGKRKTTLKVTEKGGVSMYGLGRFPVTLYRGQWERLLDAAQDIRAFIEAHASELSTKD